MSEEAFLRGIIGVPNAPFTKSGALDEESLERYAAQSLRCGSVGFLAPGLAAEPGKLSEAERIQFVRAMVKGAAGRVPVIAGLAAVSASDRLRVAQQLVGEGCEGLLVNLPFESEESYRRQVKELAEVGARFLMVQDWDFGGYGLPAEFVARLFEEIAEFRCFKVEVAPAGVKYTDMLERTGGRLHVSGGWAGCQMIEALDRGVHAFIPSILHDVYGRIFQLHWAGRRDEAKALFAELLPIISFSHQHLDISIHFNKRLLEAQGIFATHLSREPMLPFDRFHERVAGDLIEQALELSRRVGEVVDQ